MSVQQALTIRDVQKITSLSRATIYRLIGTGQFPKPIKLTARRVVWPSTLIQSWITAQQN